MKYYIDWHGRFEDGEGEPMNLDLRFVGNDKADCERKIASLIRKEMDAGWDCTEDRIVEEGLL